MKNYILGLISSKSINEEVQNVEEEGNNTKNPFETPVAQGKVMTFLPKIGVSSNTAVLSLSGFFLIYRYYCYHRIKKKQS